MPSDQPSGCSYPSPYSVVPTKPGFYWFTGCYLTQGKWALVEVFRPLWIDPDRQDLQWRYLDGSGSYPLTGGEWSTQVLPPDMPNNQGHPSQPLVKVFEKMDGEYEVSYRVALMMNEPRKGGGVTRWSRPETKVVRATGEKDAQAQFREWAKTDEGRRKLWIAWEIVAISLLPNDQEEPRRKL